MMIQWWTRNREMGDEDENDIENTSGYEKAAVQLASLGLEYRVSGILCTRSGLVPAVTGMVN
jgi:hypothetical protein